MVVFLFSLGLFFNTPANSLQLTEIQIPQPPSVYTGRVLHEVPISQEEPVLDVLHKRPVIDFLPEEVSPKRRPKVEILEDDDGEYENYLHTRGISPHSYDSKDEPYSLTVVDRSNNPTFTQELKATAETFIYCSEAHQLSVPSSQPVHNTESPTITVLFPSSALNGTIPHLESYIDDPENSLLEVSCQILNITVYPFYHRVDGSNLPLIGSN